MRTFTRIVLPVMIIIGLVGALSYVLQYTPTAVTKAGPAKATTTTGPSLEIPDRVAIWDYENPNYQGEFELNGQQAVYDFWVSNPHPVPANLVLRGVSCGKCTHLELGIVKPEAVAHALEVRARLGAALSLLGQPGIDLSGLVTATLPSAIQFEPLSVNEAVHTIPAVNPRFGNQLAIIRFKIDPITIGSQRITGDINYTGGDPKPAEARFEVPLVVVSPVQVCPNTVKMDEIKAGSGDVKFINYFMWTATRDSFPLTLPKLDDPNFVFMQPRSLTPAECQFLATHLPVEYPTQPPTKVRAAYNVMLAVHENLNGQLIELGPFSRKLTFNAGTPFETTAMVSGNVRGDIRVEGNKDDDQQIALANFRADLPLNKVVLLTSSRSDVKLRLISTSPPAIKTTLKDRPGFGGGWELRLEIPPNAISGPLPTGSSIVLEIEGQNPRRVRIPLSGVAYLP